MRIISKDKLPPDYHHQSVIKCKERNHYYKMAVALERTLASCNEMYAAYEAHTLIFRENSQKEGFIAGFETFLSQLVNFLDNYEERQQARLVKLRESILNTIKESFHDTVIIERIIHNLQMQCNQQKPLRIILPKSVQLPEDIDTSNYILTDDNHITIQNEMDSIRFPIDSVCHQWMINADNAIYPLSQEISGLIPALLKNIMQYSSKID